MQKQEQGFVRLVMLGGPGAGKGTQGQLLCSHFNIPWLSTGDILRQAIVSQTDLGRKAQMYVDKGELVPDETLIDFIRYRLLQPDMSGCWILDGYPRTAFQAEELDFSLDELGQHLNWAIWLDVPDSVLIDRSVARSRSDDLLEIVQHRIDLFRDRTIPILEYYEHRQRLLTINGDRTPEQVQQEILQKLGHGA